MSTNARQPLVTSDPTNPLDVEVRDSDCIDVESRMVIDSIGDVWVAVYEYACDGSLLSVNFHDLEGNPAGSGEPALPLSPAGDCQSGFGGPPVITELSTSGDTHTTDANARRITINYQANSASGANRPTIDVNGAGSPTTLGKNGDQSQIIFGTLDTCNVLGYTLTIEVNQNNQDIDIIEEF